MMRTALLASGKCEKAALVPSGLWIRRLAILRWAGELAPEVEFVSGPAG